MRFQAHFIGAFALTDEQGRSVLPGMRKTRALVARILLAGGEPVARSGLIELAWKDRDAEQGRASLRQALYEARALTCGQPPLIFANRTTVRANPAVLDSDLDQLRAAAQRGDPHTLTHVLGSGPPQLLADLDGICPAIDAWLADARRQMQAELDEAMSAMAGPALDGGLTTERQGASALPTAPRPRLTLSHAAQAKSGQPGLIGVLVAGAALLILIGGATWAWRSRPAAPRRVLAVEPLQAASGDGPALAVRRGLSGDLAHALVGNPARIMVGQVGEPGVRATDADLIVSGDVATLGGRLQAHVQLASARGGILWANDFAGDPGSPDVVRQQIATKADAVINCALSTRHGGAARIGDEADRLYLKACDLIEQYRLPEALQPLRQVTALEPGFARAWADLATTQALTVDASDPARRAAAYREAAANARRALALDPQTGLAYYALAQTMPGIANWRRRVDVIARGLKVETDGSELNNAMARELQRVGRSREAITYFRRSMASDPLNPVKTASLFTALAFDGRLDEAELLIDRALQLWPRNPIIWRRAFMVELRAGDPKRAEAMLDDADRPGLRDPREADQARQWLKVRRDPSAKNLAAAMEPAADPHADRLPEAVDMAALGHIDEAYRLALDPAAGIDEAEDWLLFHDGLAAFRDDPRFMTLAARRGLPAIWQATGIWPDFCAGSRHRDCGPSGSDHLLPVARAKAAPTG